MTLAQRVARLERRRPPPPPLSDEDRAYAEHLYCHLGSAVRRELDQAAQRKETGSPMSAAAEQRLYDLLEDGHRQMKVCPLRWEECCTLLEP